MQPVDYADVESRLSRSDNLSSKMHPFPCSALLTCFGNAHENTPFDQPNASPLAMEEEKTGATSAVYLQPAASSIKHGEERDSQEMFKASRCSEKHSHASSNSSNHIAAQSVSAAMELSVFAASKLSHEFIALCTHIPRPSIIHVPKDEDEEKEDSKKELDLPVLENEPLPELGTNEAVPAVLLSPLRGTNYIPVELMTENHSHSHLQMQKKKKLKRKKKVKDLLQSRDPSLSGSNAYLYSLDSFCLQASYTV